ncbi:MAG TPA: tRNA lysidine(34) synthetase TilS, partial [Armatimonadota bacterium]|nr:tRNA lysidine(34) synthetase TilS [Armatimonadota bacterium]
MAAHPRQTDEIAPRIITTVQAQGLWEHGARLLLAVSGGVDSAVMLHLLATEVAPAMGVRLAVAHVNHRLRADAAEDAAFVSARAASYGLPFLLRAVDVPARVAETGESVEDAARTLRYAALRAMAADADCTRIATAHTADDQAETVLMRLLRGAGLTGLRGIPPRRGDIVRPLLSCWRREIETYAAARNLPFRLDATNLSTAFFRNRIRHDLLPLLERDYAPRLRERLANLAELARADAAYLDGLAESRYRAVRVPIPDGIMLPFLADEARALRWRVWRLAIADARGAREDIGYAHLAAIEALQPREAVHLPGLRVVREEGALLFLPAGNAEITIPPQALPSPGALHFPGIGRLTAVRSPRPLPLVGGDEAVLDAASADPPLTVRGWQPGDRYRPFGAPGSRKLQDIFVDAGVPKRLRGRIPVVLDARGIIWVAGFRIADRVKMVST